MDNTCGFASLEEREKWRQAQEKRVVRTKIIGELEVFIGQYRILSPNDDTQERELKRIFSSLGLIAPADFPFDHIGKRTDRLRELITALEEEDNAVPEGRTTAGKVDAILVNEQSIDITEEAIKNGIGENLERVVDYTECNYILKRTDGNDIHIQIVHTKSDSTLDYRIGIIKEGKAYLWSGLLSDEQNEFIAQQLGVPL